MQENGLKRRAEKLLNFQTVSMLTTLHEYKIRQNEGIAIRQETKESLADCRIIQSAETFSAFSHFAMDADRLKKLALDKTIPKTREEQELAGFRDILRVIDENYAFIPINSGQILQLHKGLYRYLGSAGGGQFQNTEKIKALDALCEQYENAIAEGFDPLLLISIFVLDFLALEPFCEGNEAMSGLLALLLFYRAGYLVGEYICIGSQIESTQEEYRKCLQDHERGEDLPFVKYLLQILKTAYEEFFEKVKVYETDCSKSDQVRELIKYTMGPITKSEILQGCPGVSLVTVQRTLNELVKNGVIEKIGGGRYTQYIWKEKEE